MLKQLLQRLALEHQDGLPLLEDLDSYLRDFIPQALLKSSSLQQAFGISHQEMELLYKEAYLQYENNKLEEASITFRFLVLFDPWIKKHWMGLASCQQLRKFYDKALHSYAIAAALDSEDPYPHFYAYQCCLASNNLIDAQKALLLAYQRTSEPCHAKLRHKIEFLHQRVFSSTCKI